MDDAVTSALVVCVCFDEQFALHGSMAVLSAAWSVPSGVKLHAYLVDTGVTVETAERVHRVLKAASVGYSWLRPDLEDLKRLPLPDPTWLNHSTFARLLLPDLLPAEVERFLYLDSDTIVVDDIRKLLYSGMDGAVVMACEDSLYSPIEKSASGEVHRNLGMDDSDGYFNAGIMVFDCGAWREGRLRERVFDLILQHGQSFKHADQDALNIALRGRWKALDQRWNATSNLFNPTNGSFPAITENPGIIHYTGPNPGTKGCFHSRRSLFYRIVRKSGWSGRIDSSKWVLGLELRIIVSMQFRRLKRVIKGLLGRG